MAEVEQNTPEWVQIRLGKVTASNVHKVLAKPKKRGQTESTTRRNYISQLAIEILTGKSAEPQIGNWYMEQGTKLEPMARAEYELQVSEMVLTAGFIEHPRLLRAGCSPDALVGDKGLAQFKCPILAIHFEYFRSAKIGKVPPQHYPQMQFELACCADREWNDFVSFNPQYPADRRRVVIRADRDEPYIKDMESEVMAFNQEVDEMVAELRGTESSMVEILERSLELSQQDVETVFPQ